MILRKPYAMLIKYFKLIHIFLTLCMSYLIYRSYMISSFLMEYMKTSMMPLGFGATNELVGTMFYLTPIIVLAILAVILVTMIKKQKPKLFYIISTLTYILCFILYNYLGTMLKTLEEQIIAIRDIRLAYDLTSMMLVAQVIVVLITLVRAIGFDIKKFDFKKDLLEMDIVDEDNEEFEVSFNVEGNKIKRFFNKNLRTLKYIYLEHKFFFKILGIFLIIFTSYSIYKNSNINHQLLNEGDAFFTGNSEMQLLKTYTTVKDYKNTTIGNNTYVILEFNIKGSNKTVKLNNAKMQLKIKNEIYYPVDKGYAEKFLDLGTVYEGVNLSTEFKKYLLVYEIPSRYVKKEMKFRYLSDITEGNKSYVTFALDPVNLDENKKTQEIALGTTILLNEDILGQTKLKINSFEMAEEFTIKYSYCPVNGECYSSLEYIRPNLNTTYEKAVIKLDAEFESDPEHKMVGIGNAFNVLEKFGTIVYNVDGKTYKTKGKLSNLPAKKKKVANHFYIEMHGRILKSNYAYILIKMRDKEYKYIIKNSEKDK